MCACSTNSKRLYGEERKVLVAYYPKPELRGRTQSMRKSKSSSRLRVMILEFEVPV